MDGLRQVLGMPNADALDTVETAEALLLPYILSGLDFVDILNEDEKGPDKPLRYKLLIFMSKNYDAYKLSAPQLYNMAHVLLINASRNLGSGQFQTNRTTLTDRLDSTTTVYAPSLESELMRDLEAGNQAEKILTLAEIVFVFQTNDKEVYDLIEQWYHVNFLRTARMEIFGV